MSLKVKLRLPTEPVVPRPPEVPCAVSPLHLLARELRGRDPRKAQQVGQRVTTTFREPCAHRSGERGFVPEDGAPPTCL